MVQAVVNIDENVNRVLNVVKAKFGFRDKSEAINYVVSAYEENLMDLNLNNRSAEMEKWSAELEEFARKAGKKNLNLDPHSAYEEELDERWEKLVKRGIVKK